MSTHSLAFAGVDVITQGPEVCQGLGNRRGKIQVTFPCRSLLRGDTIYRAPQSTEQVAAFCRSLHEMSPSDSSPSPQDATSPQLATTRQLSDADKLRKVICELLETERTYVKVRVPPGSPGLPSFQPPPAP